MKFSEFLSNRTITDNGYAALKPQASIIMPTYSRNVEGLLAGCIESVLGQTFKNFEFIIIDDGSSDGSQDVLLAYARQDPRIVYVRHDSNSGLPAVRTNEGILLARSPYVGFIFDDNTWLPDTLERLIAAIETSSADAVYGRVVMEQDGGNFEYGMIPFSMEVLSSINLIPNGTILCTRHFFDTAGLYDPHLLVRRICDWDLWLRAARQGMHFKQIDAALGVERGLRSRVSLGNTVRLDTKITFSYVFDTDLHGERTRKLLPDQIMEYDVFDTEIIMSCVRNQAEWEQVKETVYQPFFDRHPYYRFGEPLRSNRRYDAALFGYRINAMHPVFRPRKRLLILTNRTTRAVSDIVDALKSNPDWLVLPSSELSSRLFAPEEIDALILVDCTEPATLDFVKACREQNIPVVYLVMHGLDIEKKQGQPALTYLDLTRHQNVIDQFKISLYFSLAGFPWPDDQRDQAREYMTQSDLIITVGSSPDPMLNELPVVRLGFLPNVLSNQHEPEPREIAFFLANPAGLAPECLARAAEEIARASRDQNLPVSLYISDRSDLPASFASLAESLNIVESNDTLPALICRFANLAWVVPAELVELHSGYHQQLMLEDLARGGGILLPLAETAPGIVFTPEEITLRAASLLTAFQEAGNGYRHDARWLHFRNLIQGTFLRKKIANLNSLPLASEVNSLVMINSQAMAGSETYGLLVAKALHNLGFDIQVATHASYDHYSPGIRAINEWLIVRGLRPLLKAEYGKVARSINLPAVPEESLQVYSNQFDKWLDSQSIELVFSSGFISEPLIGWNKRRLYFMSLFAPWDYYLARMTYLRYRVNGTVFDTEWARKHWARWLPPPTRCVPSLVEQDYFTIRNQNLALKPIRIAIAGTIQPRKRQKEAVIAFLNLVDQGYDIELHLYGYELISFKNYIDEIHDLVSRSVFEKRVFFHGFVENSLEISRDNHIIFSPSTDESLPQSLLFNQASGLIAVTTPAGGAEEFVQDGITGFLGRGFTEDALTEVLRRALDRQAEWPEMIQKARQHIVEQCSEQVFALKLLEVMEHGTDIHISEGRYAFNASPQAHYRRPVSGRRIKNIAMDPINIANLVIGPEIKPVPVFYKLHCQQNYLAGLHFRIGTFLSKPAGKITLRLFSRHGGPLLRQISIDMSHIADNDWTLATFDPVANSANHDYIIEVQGEISNGRAAIYENLPSRFMKANRLVLKGERALRKVLPLSIGRPLAAFYPFYDR